MKKIYSFIALMLFLFVGNAQAQRSWKLSDAPVQEIVADTSHYYALQEGFNSGSWSSNGYLNSKHDDVCESVDNSCIYNFIPMGQIEVEGEVFPTYILKNIENGLYLCEAGSHYTNKKQEAFVFTVRLAEEKYFEQFGEWIEYSNAAHSERCIGAQEAGAIIMCSPSEPKFISFGGNPTFWPYIDTNNWLLYEATEEVLGEYEKFCIIYDEYWANGLSEELYPVGNTPGCISQEYFDRLKALYEKSDVLINDSERSDEEYISCREEIIATWAEYNDNLVKIQEGYYVIRSDRGNALLIEQNNNWRTQKNIEEIPTEWTIENAGYIWKFTPDEKNEGRFFFQNFRTGHYTGRGNGGGWPMTENPEVSIQPIVKKGVFFLMHDGNHYAANNGNNSIVTWDDVNDPGDWFKFIPVDKHICDSLNGLVAQKHMDEQLKDLILQVKSKMASLKLKNGFTEDGNYYQGSEGLINDFENLNCQETVEGPKEDAFDGRPETHFHSVWSTAGPADNDWHWVQFDMGKEVDEIILKMTTRWKNSKNRPTKFSFVVPETGDITAPVWMDTIFKADTAIYTYNTIYNGIPTDSSTYIQKIKFPKAVQHVRFVVTETQNHARNGNVPFWGVGEFRVYDVKDCVENPLYTMVPQELKDACNAEIAKSEVAVENHVSTQELYDALEKAFKKLLEAYPDPSTLKNEIAYAQKLADAADESSEEIGYYQEGAKVALQAVIDAVKAEADSDKTLTLEELTNLRNKLAEGVKNFTAMMIVPENGMIYMIKSTAEENENDKYVPGSYIHSANADINDTPYWNYKNEEDLSLRWDAMWIVEKNDNGLFAFKNVANGLYMGNPYEGLTEEEQEKIDSPAKAGYSATPKYFTFRSASKSGSLLIDMADGQYVNCDPHGYVVAWADPNDVHATFTFVNVTENEFNESYFINCKKNTTQIITLPITVNGVYGIEGNIAYKVLGRKNNEVKLSLYEDGEAIEAGTPFVLLTGAEENTFEVVPSVMSFDDLFNMTYNYEQVEQNGLVSAPRTIKPGAGYGVLGSYLIEATLDDDVIEAGEGFFNKNIPATEEEGTLSLTIEGDIFGDGTGISSENLIIKDNASTDVYNIAGVKVRSNVKGTDAVKGLAKGIYIIGGKKVIVK